MAGELTRRGSTGYRQMAEGKRHLNARIYELLDSDAVAEGSFKN